MVSVLVSTLNVAIALNCAMWGRMDRNRVMRIWLQAVAFGLVAAAAGFGGGMALASQPQMEGALRSLLSAQTELERVTLNKGGHAARARVLVAKAVGEVQAGIQYGREHGY